jgi:hypothetical protein
MAIFFIKFLPVNGSERLINVGMNTAPMSPLSGGFWGRHVLLIALVLAAGLSLIGIHWGRYEDWNFDQMAFCGLLPNGLPGNYLKPPLHTYLTHLLVIEPVGLFARFLNANPADPNRSFAVIILAGHLLTVLLYCGSVTLLYKTVQGTCGRQSAGILALLMATSAGIIQFNHYGTADSPLIFWVLASFAMSARTSCTGKALDAIAAGLLAGLAAADKYNGLGVAAAIPVALLLRSGWKCLIRLPLWAGVIAVPLGFILGNPGAVLDTRKFVQDFLYNLYTTPVYYGNTHKLGYLAFLGSFPELIGLPVSVIIAGAVAGTVLLLIRKKLASDEIPLTAMAGAVFLFYFITIGRFPRLEARFILPIIPFALMLAAPALQRIRFREKLPLLLFVLVMAYNIVCCIGLGIRFLGDPRMNAQIYAMKNFPRGAKVENTYSPEWNLLPGVFVQEKALNCECGHQERFTKIFGNNAVIQKGLKEFATSDPAYLFTPEALKERNPDFITFSSVTYVIAHDPETQRFYKDLEAGRLGYVKVYDRELIRPPRWMYPSQSDALMERMIILKRAGR